MTNEEAKTVLINCATFIKDGFRYMKEEHQEQFKEAYRMATEALEKQIPKRPILNEYELFYCPVCGADFDSIMYSGGETFGFKYCRDCGQALDWSEE